MTLGNNMQFTYLRLSKKKQNRLIDQFFLSSTCQSKALTTYVLPAKPKLISEVNQTKVHLPQPQMRSTLNYCIPTYNYKIATVTIFKGKRKCLLQRTQIQSFWKRECVSIRLSIILLWMDIFNGSILTFKSISFLWEYYWYIHKPR